MKRFITILIMLILFGITGCGSGADYSSEEITTEAMQNEQNEISKINYNFDKNPYYQKDNHNVVAAEEGYYFVRNTSMNGVMVTIMLILEDLLLIHQVMCFS